MKHFTSYKLLSLFIVLVQLFLVCVPCSSVDMVSGDESKNESETMAQQERIDQLFSELNDLAVMSKQQSCSDVSSFSATQDQLLSMESEVEQELFALGIRKIDPNNPEDISRISSVMTSSIERAGSVFNFDMLADVYSIYEYSGTRTVNGNSYNYKYYRIIDNKGYVDTALTHTEIVVPVENVNTTIGELLEYNFSYGFSAFLGTLPGGNVADWFIGGIFTILESYNSNSTVAYTGNGNIYSLNMLSVTAMTYYYIEMDDNWYLCGSRASDVSFARSDSFVANVNGKAYSDSKSYPSWNSSTGYSWYWYIDNYVNTKKVYHSTIGSIAIFRDSTFVHNFYPSYVTSPWGLI